MHLAALVLVMVRDAATPAQTYAHQKELPLLPVPDLADTVTRWLKSVRPLVSAEEYAEAERLARDFARPGGVGETLNARLRDRAAAKSESSWIMELWRENAYLRPRCSLPINVSYYFQFKRTETCFGRDHCTYAAALLNATEDVRQSLIKCGLAALPSSPRLTPPPRRFRRRRCAQRHVSRGQDGPRREAALHAHVQAPLQRLPHSQAAAGRLRDARLQPAHPRGGHAQEPLLFPGSVDPRRERRRASPVHGRDCQVSPAPPCSGESGGNAARCVRTRHTASCRASWQRRVRRAPRQSAC